MQMLRHQKIWAMRFHSGQTRIRVIVVGLKPSGDVPVVFKFWFMIMTQTKTLNSFLVLHVR